MRMVASGRGGVVVLCVSLGLLMWGRVEGREGVRRGAFVGPVIACVCVCERQRGCACVRAT